MGTRFISHLMVGGEPLITGADMTPEISFLSVGVLKLVIPYSHPDRKVSS